MGAGVGGAGRSRLVPVGSLVRDGLVQSSGSEGGQETDLHLTLLGRREWRALLLSLGEADAWSICKETFFYYFNGRAQEITA